MTHHLPRLPGSPLPRRPEQGRLRLESWPPLTLLIGLCLPPWVSAQTEKHPKSAAPAAVQFDTDTLLQRGIDPRVADFFSQQPRFAAGTRRVSLLVNGVARGTVDATFDAQGQLCFTHALLDQGHLKVPALTDNRAWTDACLDFLTEFPQTEVQLRPGREEVALVVTAQTLRPPNEDLGVFSRGGTAGLLNYELMGYQYQSFGQSGHYLSANTEVGLNTGDWLLRSRQGYSLHETGNDLQWLSAYAQTTWVEHKTILQLGQINMANSVFAGAPINGLQLLPDTALHNQRRAGATVEGIAQSQARVEVRQSGVLIHTTLVPAGPFRLPDIPLLTSNSDLEVTVIETHGEQRQFVIPAASLAQYAHTTPGYSLALGQVRSYSGSDQETPALITGTGSWLLSPQYSLAAGLMASQNQYQAFAFTLDSRLFTRSSLNWRSALSHAGEEGVFGAQTGVGFGTLLTKTLNASLNYTRQTQSYRDLLDTTRPRAPGETRSMGRDQYGASLGWSHPLLGGFGATYSTGTRFDGQQSHHLNGSWGKSFRYFSVNANVERSLSRDSGRQIDREPRQLKSKALYVNLNIPLGANHSLRSYATQRDETTRFGSALSGSNEWANYQVGADSDTRERQRDYFGNISLVPLYTSLNLGYQQSGEDSTSYNGQLSGGLAVHGEGMTFSPYPLQDTFAVAQVGDMAGVKLSTPSGPVWTDWWGRAVIPQLSAYQSSQIEIATKTLPRNVDINNGVKAVTAGRGSVNKVDFSVITTRRVLLRSQDASGNHLRRGGGVFTLEDQFVTTVLDNGKIFLSNEQLNEALVVRQEDGHHCQLDFTLPDKADPSVYFESAEAVCTPL